MWHCLKAAVVYCVEYLSQRSKHTKIVLILVRQCKTFVLGSCFRTLVVNLV